MEIDTGSPVREQIGADEHLLWSGRPRQGVRLRAADLFMIPFSLLWAGFAVFWEWLAVTNNAPLFFKLWGVPFVLIGLYFVFGRFFWDAYQRANTYYGVSDQRVLIVSRGLGGKVKSLNVRALSEITLTSSASGIASIQFGSSPWGAASWFGSSGWPGVQSAPTFELVDNAKQVYEIIRNAQQKLA